MEKYPREAVAAVVRKTARPDDIVTILQQEEGVNEYLAELAMRVASSQTTEMLLGLADLRRAGEHLENQQEAQRWYGQQASEMGIAGFSMAFLRGVWFGMLLERDAAAVEEVPLEQHYTRDNLPPEDEFNRFAKSGTTLLWRVNGPFSVKTKEGVCTCQDGWLAIDVEGDPYPVADAVFRKSYAVQ